MPTRNELLVQNQREFRHANERLEQLSAEVVTDGSWSPSYVSVRTTVVWDGSKSRSAATETSTSIVTCTVVLPGHPRVEGEATVEDNDYYQVVKKGGEH
jgi:hypothetical protein